MLVYVRSREAPRAPIDTSTTCVDTGVWRLRRRITWGWRRASQRMQMQATPQAAVAANRGPGARLPSAIGLGRARNAQSVRTEVTHQSAAAAAGTALSRRRGGGGGRAATVANGETGLATTVAGTHRLMPARNPPASLPCPPLPLLGSSHGCVPSHDCLCSRDYTMQGMEQFLLAVI
jgi:hypothetical protein